MTILAAEPWKNRSVGRCSREDADRSLVGGGKADRAGCQFGKTNTGHKIALRPQNTLLKGEIRAIRVITQIDQLTTRWPARVHFKKSGGKLSRDC